MDHFPVNYNVGSSFHQDIYADYWTFEEEKLFERALATLPAGQDIYSLDLLEKIGYQISVPGKTPDQIRKHLELLIKDVNFIESYDGPIHYDPAPEGKNTTMNSPSICPDDQKKKGIARWTKEEHEKFLVGLAKYGRGDWKSISRYIVTTKSPTQVASHAQKYFIREAKAAKAAKQSSSSSSTQQTSISQTTFPPKPADQTPFTN